MKIQQLWIHRIAWAAIQSHHKNKKTVAQKTAKHTAEGQEHKSMDSEEDEEPRNGPGTSSNSHTTVPVLPLHQGPKVSSQGPAAKADTGNEDSEYSVEYSAQSQDSGRTVLYPDLYILTDDEHWAMTSESHICATAPGSFCFVTTENGRQQDIYNLTTMPCGQRSSYLNELTDDFGNIRVEVPKKELTVQREMCWNDVWLPAEEQQEQ